MLPITILDVLLLGFIIPQIYHRNGKNNLFNPIYNLYHIFTRLVINYWSPTAALIPCAIWGTPLMIYCRYLVLVILVCMECKSNSMYWLYVVCNTRSRTCTCKLALQNNILTQIFKAIGEIMRTSILLRNLFTSKVTQPLTGC